MQSRGASPADALGRQSGAKAGHEQGFTRIDIAHAHHHSSPQEKGFDGRSSLVQSLVKGLGLEAWLQGLHPQMAEQLLGLRAVLARGIDHSAKTARIVQSQTPLRCHQVKVVVWPRLGPPWPHPQAARHAQMPQQKAFAQVHQEVLAAAAHVQNRAPHQILGQVLERPAQGFAHVYRLNASPTQGAR